MRFAGSIILRIILLTLTVPAGIAAVSARESRGESTGTFKLLVLDSQKGKPYDEMCSALFTSLAGYGYTEGKNLKTTVRYLDNDTRRGEQILLAERKNSYDVIYTLGTSATLAAKNILYGKAQRVVFASVTDPVGIGLIRDFSRKPPANFTGVSYPVPVKTRLKFIRRLLPKAKTLGLIYADMPQSHSYKQWLEDFLKNDPEFRDLRIIFRKVPLIGGENGEKRMAAIAKQFIREIDPQVDAYVSPCDQMGSRRFFPETVYGTSRKPLIGLVRDDVMEKWGATATIYPSHESIGQQSARMIKELFEGREPSQILPEWPNKFGIAVDLRKARQFGIDVPVELLQMAGENIVR